MSTETQNIAKSTHAFGLACTVAWTELHNALTADGINVPTKCGSATRAWIESVVRDTFATAHAQDDAR